jgi:hypothetical protein
MEELDHKSEEFTEPPEKQVELIEEQPPQSEIVAATVNTPNELTDMEVHHHSHSHGKKDFRTVLFEFFMLFLAVFCGFLAEYQLEHVIEHQRSKEYAKLLRKDLMDDTALANIIVTFRKQQAVSYDSLTKLVQTPYEKADKAKLQYYGQQLGAYRHFLVNNATYEQLKYSGSLRYFKNFEMLSKLMQYEGTIQHLEFLQAEEYKHSQERVSPFIISHFNANYKNAIADQAPGLINYNTETMVAYNNLFQTSKWYNSFLSEPVFNKVKEEATAIIKLLEKDYDLK